VARGVPGSLVGEVLLRETGGPMSTVPEAMPLVITRRIGRTRVVERLDGRAAVILVGGVLDEIGVEAMRKVCNAAIEAASQVRIDLALVESIDAAGLGELLRAKRAAAAAGCELSLAAPSLAVEQLVAAVASDDMRSAFGPAARREP
jgi:anti-anti-sigma factor